MSFEKEKLALKKNDQVQVIAGREKGKVGNLLKVDAKKKRVVVEKLNLVKRHTKATQTASGGIVEKEQSLDYSNVLLFCSKCNRGVRHGVKWVEKQGAKAKKTADSATAPKAKIRVCKRCDVSLETA